MIKHGKAAALALAIGLLGLAQAGPAQTITASEWTSSGKVGDFPEVMMSNTNDTWTLSVNPSQPDFCYGWLEGPLMSVSPATDSLGGNVCGLRVEYEIRTDIGQQAPELRIRMNTEDFGQYAMGGVANNKFQQVRAGGGKGTAYVEFDRRQITSTTRMRPYLELLSGMPPGSVNASWQVKILKTEFYTRVSNSAHDRDEIVTLAYMEKDGDIVVHTNGSVNRTHRYGADDDMRFFSYAWDNSWVIILEGDELRAISPLNDFAPVTIDTSDVLSAAISNHHVLYIDDDDGLKYYNLETRQSKNVDGGDDYHAVTAGPDGMLYALELRSDATFRVYQLDGRSPSPSLKRIEGDDDTWSISPRSTGIRSDRLKSSVNLPASLMRSSIARE